MSIVDACYKRAYEVQDKQFQALSEYFPLVIKHNTFSVINAQRLLDSRLSVYCRYHHIISGSDINITAAKTQITEMLYPATRIMVNYCLTVYYSSENQCNIDNELAYLNNMERNANFNENYLVSVIVVIDSEIKKDDADLINFLQNIQNINNKFDIYAFTHYKNLETSFDILIDSITASIIYRSHFASKIEYEKTEDKIRNKINNYKQNLDANSLSCVPALRWQSMCAYFGNKQLDFIAYALRAIFNSNHVITALSNDIVINEASKIAMPFGDLNILNDLLTKTFEYIPSIKSNHGSYPAQYSFYSICEEMFGKESYETVEISFKTTLADYRKRKNLSPNYENDIRVLFSNLAVYGHDNLIEAVVSGINEYILKIKSDIKEKQEDYNTFIRKLFYISETNIKEILDGYVRRFLYHEYLSAQLRYWEVMIIKINGEHILPQAAEAKRYIDEFRKIKKQLDSYRFSYMFGNISLPDIRTGCAIRDILLLSEDNEFIKYIKTVYNSYSEQAQDIAYNPERGHVLVYDPVSGVSEDVIIKKDYGAYQLNGNLLFGAYWSFM